MFEWIDGIVCLHDSHWGHRYGPKYLKKPKEGRVFALPPKKRAMRDARAIIMRLRRECRGMELEEQTAYTLAVLRVICPFVFEELLLHCMEDVGWRVRRSCYTHDGGIDGVFWDEENNKYLLQAKRYRREIKPEYLVDLCNVVRKDDEAVGGFLIHTGMTCPVSQRLVQRLDDVRILDGCGLRELVVQ